MKASGSFVFLGSDLTINTNPDAGLVSEGFSYRVMSEMIDPRKERHVVGRA